MINKNKKEQEIRGHLWISYCTKQHKKKFGNKQTYIHNWPLEFTGKECGDDHRAGGFKGGLS